MRRLLRIVGTALKWVGIGLVAILAASAIWARVLHGRDAERWKAPGRLVEVEPGRSLHIYCVGQGTPTVVLEAGLGDFGLSSWYSVLPQLAGLSRTCAYDRAGTGFSPAPTVPPTPTSIVDDLHTLLARSGEPGPYLLVGHSLGGPLVRHYATRYPTEVAGLVLVDGSHEDQLERMKLPKVAELVVHVLPAIHFLGLDRVLAGMGATDTMVAMSAARTSSDDAVANTLQLYRSLPSFMAEVKRDARPFGDLPITALTAGSMTIPGMPPAEAAAVHQAWIDMHKELVGRTTRGRWILADSATHYIQRDRPDLVIGAVKDMLEVVRAPAPPPVP